MSSKESEQRSPLEDGLIRAMRSLDVQIARALERSPAEREEKGVQKWEPIAQRVETVCSFLLDRLGDDEVRLDSVVVLAQSFAKLLTLVADDLGSEGLGAMRTSYCLAAADSIERDLLRLRSKLDGATHIN